MPLDEPAISGAAEDSLLQSDQTPAVTGTPEKEHEATSVFLDKASLPPGKRYKKGDKIELEVMDVDSESGDIQACIYTDGEGENQNGDHRMGWSDGFDKAMPESE
jgi:hypothetical protein